MAVAHEIDADAGRSDAVAVKSRRSRADDPARRRGRRLRRWPRQKQQGKPTARGRGERKPARRYVVEAARLPYFADDRRKRAAVQRLLHRPQHVTHAGSRHGDEALRLKSDLIEAEPVGLAALPQPHVLGDPQHRTPGPAGRESNREAGGGGHIRLACGRDLVEGAQGQAAAQNLVNGDNAERLCASIPERSPFSLDRRDRPAQGAQVAAAPLGAALFEKCKLGQRHSCSYAAMPFPNVRYLFL